VTTISKNDRLIPMQQASPGGVGGFADREKKLASDTCIYVNQNKA